MATTYCFSFQAASMMVRPNHLNVRRSPATLTAVNDEHQTFDVVTGATVGWWDRVKAHLSASVRGSPGLQALLCLSGSDLAAYELDGDIRRAAQRAVLDHSAQQGEQHTCVGQVMTEVFLETGYDLGDMGYIRRANEGVKRTKKEWDAYFAQLGAKHRTGAEWLAVFKRVGLNDLKRNARGGIESSKVRIIPKFAAAVALHIRAKLGKLQTNESNLLLVQRKYLEICHNHGVRDSDMIMHQQHVMNLVFDLQIADSVALSRRRVPRWLQWLDGVKPRSTNEVTVC